MLRTLSNRHAFVRHSLLGLLMLATATVFADTSSPGVSEPASDANFAELRTSRAISEAEVLKSKAELELATWKLEQLTKLRQRGHATWQERAQQERIVHSLRAGHEAASEHLELIHKIAAQVHVVSKAGKGNTVAKNDDTIRLFVPESMRLIAWVPIQHANTQLLERQLTNLREQLAAAAKINTQELEAKASQTKARFEHYSHVTAATQRDNSNEANADRAKTDLAKAHQAKAAHELAVADLRLASAHKSLGAHVQQRIARIEVELTKRAKSGESDTQSKEGVIAKLGTPFVTASNNQSLETLTNDVAILEANSTAPLKLTSLLSKIQGERVATLVELHSKSGSGQSESEELLQARQQLVELSSAIQAEQATKTTQLELVSSLRSTDNTADSSQLHTHNNLAFPAIKQTVTQSPAALRHFLELHRKWTSLHAANESAKGDLAYLTSRRRKIEEIPAKHRAPKELEQASQNADLAAERITAIQESLAILSHEANRFVAQCEAQNSNEYQFVQSAGDTFVPRSAFKRQEAMMSVVGFVGSSMNLHCGYVESPAIFRVLTTLTTSIRSQVSATQTADLINDGEIGFSTRRAAANSATFKTLPQTRGIRLATDGITYPRDLFNYVPSDLWQQVSASSLPRQGYGYAPIRYDRGIGRYASRGQSLGYSSTNFTSGPFDRSNFYDGVNAPGVVTQFYSRIPRYSDYYSFGVRRYDGPAGTSFRRGSRAYSPFYRPGFPTNFRY